MSSAFCSSLLRFIFCGKGSAMPPITHAPYEHEDFHILKHFRAPRFMHLAIIIFESATNLYTLSHHFFLIDRHKKDNAGIFVISWRWFVAYKAREYTPLFLFR